MVINEIFNLEFGNTDHINFNHINIVEKHKLINLSREYQNFIYKEGEQLTCTHEVQHEIVITINAPIYSKIYRYPRIHENEIEKQIKEMMDQKIIVPSSSP